MHEIHALPSCTFDKAPEGCPLSANALCTPSQVFFDYALDQSHKIVCQRWSALLVLGFRLAPPYPPKQLAMPAQHGVWLDDDQRILPRAQLACQEHDQGPISPGEFRTFGLALEHD
jgi:hypothetical protein